jgi:glycosyltransferase involved in cell wall biosynthesis
MLRRLLGREPAAGERVVPPEVEYADVLRYELEGPATLAPGGAQLSGASRLRVAVVIPIFMEGSGGHNTILNLIRRLEALGHECSLWLHDPGGVHAAYAESTLENWIREWFGGMEGPFHNGFEAWRGADVVLATGWQTVRHALMLEDVRARAYLVQDHEPEFEPTSARSRWAEETYRMPLQCITAGRWLRDLVTQNYGASASWFELGVDRSLYRPRDVQRSESTVLFYSRSTTPRRAAELGLLALSELRRRRPDVQVELFGDPRRTGAASGYHDLGILPPGDLPSAYSQATVGMVLSMTNYSLIAQEMLACGLPCVELDTPSTRAAFGTGGPVELAPFRVLAVADALETLLADPALRAARSAAGLELVRDRTWDAAAVRVDAGLRESLRLTEE